MLIKQINPAIKMCLYSLVARGFRSRLITCPQEPVTAQQSQINAGSGPNFSRLNHVKPTSLLAKPDMDLYGIIVV